MNAVPVLEKYNFKASFWIITGCADGDFGKEYLLWPDIVKLDIHRNFVVGSHTVTHPWDPSSTLVSWMEGKPAGRGPADVRFELEASKKALETHLHRPVNYLAWPMGLHTPALVEMAKDAGYEALLTTWQQPNRVRGDVFHIRRFFVDGSRDLATFEEILKGVRSSEVHESHASVQ